MQSPTMDRLEREVRELRPVRPVGRVTRATHGLVTVEALAQVAALGDGLRIDTSVGAMRAEVVDLRQDGVVALIDGPGAGVQLGDRATCIGPPSLLPDKSWLGRVIDPHGAPLDGRHLRRGPRARPIHGPPPKVQDRRGLGARLSTGMALFDTLLPLARGQRIGLFAGSGVGKSTLLGRFANGVEADVVVLVLVGERGREVREFAEKILDETGKARSVMIVATSDQPPLTRRQALWSGMTVAEYFRDAGLHVLFLADSITRFAEAHREVALASGELAALRGFPPSMLQLITQMAERAGPGETSAAGDISAVMTVLVAGSDMDEPVADALRGTLDGHVVMDRAIAERGRFPAVDVVRSVSRSLPEAATGSEMTIIARTRRMLALYDRAEIMVQSGLYTAGADPELDAAVALFPRLDAFLSETIPAGPEAAFARLASLLRQVIG